MTDEMKSASAEMPSACLAPRFRKSRFNPPEAAEYMAEAHGVQVAVATLNKMRSIGGGPQYLKFSRAVFYEKTALDAWVAERLGTPRRSTTTA